jgi:hypothetical protein
MFGKLFGRSNKDRAVAEILLTYLVGFHRTYAQMGLDSLIRNIKRSPLVTWFTEDRDWKAFSIQQDLDDFQFTLINLSIAGSKPAVAVSGRDIYRGFEAQVDLPDGKLTLMPSAEQLTSRAQSLSRNFDLLRNEVRFRSGMHQ